VSFSETLYPGWTIWKKIEPETFEAANGYSRNGEQVCRKYHLHLCEHCCG